MTIVVGLAPAALGQSMDWLSLGAKMPRNTMIALSGTDTAHAQASTRIELGDARDHCENFSPSSVESCATGLIESEAGRIYGATADCLAGTINTVYGHEYSFAGYWQGDWGNGRSRWRDGQGKIVPTDNASDGLSISQQWEVLCPTARPTATLAFSPGGATNWVVGIEHNGSSMWHDEDNGVLYYDRPKASLAGLVASGTVLFEGDPWTFSKRFSMAGTAYTFRQGCAPAPYQVTGGFVAGATIYDHDRIVLRGAAPIREKNGCAVVGYTTDSGNAELVFTLNYGDI